MSLRQGWLNSLFFAVFLGLLLLYVTLTYPLPLGPSSNETLFGPPTVLSGSRVMDLSNCSGVSTQKSRTGTPQPGFGLCVTVTYLWNATLLSPSKAITIWTIHHRNVSNCLIPALWVSTLPLIDHQLRFMPVNPPITMGMFETSGVVYVYGQYYYDSTCSAGS